MTDKKVILVIEPELSMEDINARIKQEVCYETLEELTDVKLMCEYKDCNSVKNEIKKLTYKDFNNQKYIDILKNKHSKFLNAGIKKWPLLSLIRIIKKWIRPVSSQ
mgnify:CR=1 FL=1